MSRPISTTEARKMAAQRKTRAGGRPRVETLCPKCGALCPSATHARIHCSK